MTKANYLLRVKGFNVEYIVGNELAAGLVEKRDELMAMIIVKDTQSSFHFQTNRIKINMLNKCTFREVHLDGDNILALA